MACTGMVVQETAGLLVANYQVQTPALSFRQKPGSLSAPAGILQLLCLNQQLTETTSIPADICSKPYSVTG